MPGKQFDIDGIGPITVYKRKRAKNLRLSLAADGSIRLSMPYWTPYAAGLSFVKSRKVWILKSRPAVIPANFESGDTIGKFHTLRIDKGNHSAVRISLKANEVTVKIPSGLTQADQEAAIRKAAERALKKEATENLTKRLAAFAHQHGYEYSEVAIKKMKTRWGSCSSSKKITLNIFLMQLPWELIDFVILHELAHTKQMNHGEKFWAELGKHFENPKKMQKMVRNYKPAILGR